MKLSLHRRIFRVVTFSTFACFLLWSQLAHAQSPDETAAGRANLPIQRIGVDDLVAVQVYDSPELTRTERVAPDGTLKLPLLTQPIKAAGLFPADLEKELRDELKLEGILVRPIVSVTVSDYRSRPISVVGAVNHPLTFQAYGSVTLLDAISRASGLSDQAGSEILVTRPSTEGGQSLLERIPVKGLIDRADPTMNPKLTGGEEVRVPEGGRVFVMGNVRKPGAIPVHDINELTVLRVISQAEGLEPYANKEAYILRHGDKTNEIPVPLSKIMERKAPDVQLEANDVLYVPENKRSKTMSKSLGAAGQVGMGTVSGLLIWR